MMIVLLTLLGCALAALALLAFAARLSISDVDRYLSDVDRLWDSGGDT